MKTHLASFDAMMAAWNERDPQAIRSHLDQALSADVQFIDPTIETNGLTDFEANVREFRAKYPNAQCIRTSSIDSHHQVHRYSWEIKAGGQLIMSGFDVAETDAQGKVRRVLGFFGPLPQLLA
jgi:SnoaL-like domain